MGQKMRVKADQAEDEEEHKDMDWFYKLFMDFGVGTLTDRGVPSSTGFTAACGPLQMNLRIRENALFVWRMFRCCAGGMNEAHEDARP